MNEAGPYAKSERINLLTELDEELDRRDYHGALRLDVVGGFAMLMHGLRHNDPYTPDIDVCVPSFDETTRAAIDAVSERNGISSYWLNNHTVLPFDSDDGVATQEDVDVANSVMFAKYQPTDTKFAHIALDVATIPTLVYGKALAASDVFADRNATDIDDLCDIFAEVGVHSLEDAYRRFPNLKQPEFENFANVYEIANATRSDSEDYLMHIADLAVRELDLDDFDYEAIAFADGFDTTEFDMAFDEDYF